MTKTTALFGRLAARWGRSENLVRRTGTARALPFVEALETRALLSIVLTNEHTDLDVTYSAVDGRLHLAENNKSVDPIAYYPAVEDEKAMHGDVPVILEFLPEAARPQTSDPRFAFIGANAGDTIWVVPISPRDPRLLQLGVSGERIDSDTLGAYSESDPRISPIPLPWIRLTLIDVRGPGYFSVWQTDDFGSPTVWVATAGNPRGPDIFFTAPGAHVDYNWAFTAPGDYEVDLQASAFLPDDTPVQSFVTTYHFQVDDVPGNRTVVKNTHQLDALFTVTSQFTAENPTAFALPTPTGSTAVREAPGVTAIDQAFALHRQGPSSSNAASAERILAGQEATYHADIARDLFDAVIF